MTESYQRKDETKIKQSTLHAGKEQDSKLGKPPSKKIEMQKNIPEMTQAIPEEKTRQFGKPAEDKVKDDKTSKKKDVEKEEKEIMDKGSKDAKKEEMKKDKGKKDSSKEHEKDEEKKER